MGATVLWLRRDFRLNDHAALTAAVAPGDPVLPVFIRDTQLQTLGAAAGWRMGRAVDRFDQTLRDMGSQITYRSGDAHTVLHTLVQETGASRVYWSRSYDPVQQATDTKVKQHLKAAGIDAQSFIGHLLHEPWTYTTKTGGFYKVFTPMWKALHSRTVSPAAAQITALPTPATFPRSENLADWTLGRAMQRGAAVVARYAAVGEAAAEKRLQHFIDSKIAAYAHQRDLPGVDGTSGLSENLTYGEISPRTCWFAAQRAFQSGGAGAEVFLKELMWREFAYHLLHHTPHIRAQNWRPEWDAFPWNTDENTDHVLAWKQGRTGVPFVDAAMRQMYVTGTMHNRARMIVASYLTKHLLSHWEIGLRWFAECLTDWDPASNAMGWQWSAGSGPDATPYFRVFNPVTQLDKFDAGRVYVDRWIAEGRAAPHPDALRYFDAMPRAWRLTPDMGYPAPIVDAAEGRRIALSAYENRSF